MKLIYLVALFVLYSEAIFFSRTINCDRQSLENAFKYLTPGLTIKLKGTCNINAGLVVKVPGVTITSKHTSNPATIQTTESINVLTIEGGYTTTVTDLIFGGGANALYVHDSSSLNLRNVNIFGSTVGVTVDATSTLRIEDVSIQFSGISGLQANASSSVVVAHDSSLTVTNTFGGFGVQITGSSFVAEPNSYVEISQNLFGIHLINGANALIDQGALLNTSANTLLGGSINTGSGLILFNADYISNNNVLDGFSVSVGATVFVDQGSDVEANNNGRDGIRLEQGILRLGNTPGNPFEPAVVTNSNGRFGLSVARQSTFDSSPAGNVVGLTSVGNQLDIFADFGSAFISKNTNAGVMSLSFGSLADFVSGNSIGALFCSGVSNVRGDVNCSPPPPSP